jgi:hypothetical protein
MFAEVTAINIPGKVIWCNYDLARGLGFDVPPENSMSAELHEQLLGAISFKALRPGEPAEGQPTVTLYADKYGGDGVWPALGSARSAFLPFGNLFIKGIGFTPLFRHNDPEDFTHSHGGLGMNEALSEAMWGEVNANLFSNGSARVLAIIDLDDYTVWPSGKKIPRVVLARCGNQLRPGHVLVRRKKGDRSRLDLFISITRETGQLVIERDAATGVETPDIRATMLRVIDDHARTAAEQVRWRITHNALSASNMQMDGGMLDITTQGAHPRTTSIRLSDEELVFEKHFSSDLYDRPVQMSRLYRAVVRSVPRGLRRLMNAKSLDVQSEMKKAYRSHLEIELLSATGLKRGLAERVAARHPELARRFTEVIASMAELKNPCSAKRDRYLIERVAVLDIFQLLAGFPRIYFGGPERARTKKIRALLAPIYKGNKFHVAKKQAAAGLAIKEFARVYPEVMSAAEPFAEELYGDAARMKNSIMSRAEFENRPAPLLYWMDYLDAVFESIIEFKRTGDPQIISDLVDRRVAASLRNVAALIRQGDCRPMTDGGFELEMRAIGGINYSVRAWDDEAETRLLHVALPVEQRGQYFITHLPQRPRIAERQVRSLRYRFTVDGGATSREVSMRLERGARNQFFISGDWVPALLTAGELRGYFYDSRREDFCLNDGGRDFSGYVFAIPDRQELLELITTRPILTRRT